MSDKPTLSRKAASALQTEGAETAAKESTARTDKPAAVQPAGIDAKPAEAEVKSEHTAVKKTAVRRSTASKKTITKTVKSAKSVKTVKAVKVSASSTASLESAPPPLPPVEGVPDLSDPLLYINRELNWIEFDRKVLEEACDLSVPLLEQLKFLAIFHNNLDEFFMVRVANIIRQYKMGAASTSADGLPPVKQLAEIRRRVLGMLARAQNHWKTSLRQSLLKKTSPSGGGRISRQSRRPSLKDTLTTRFIPFSRRRPSMRGTRSRPFPICRSTLLLSSKPLTAACVMRASSAPTTCRVSSSCPARKNLPMLNWASTPPGAMTTSSCSKT